MLFFQILFRTASKWCMNWCGICFELNASKVEHDHMPNMPSHTAQWAKRQRKYRLNQVNLDWCNTVVLSILSSFWGIEAQYWLTSGAKRRRRPVLPLNSKAWWQYWPIHPTQNYCILIVSISTFVPNIVFFSILVHVLIRRIEIFQF